jgi:sec-independent protein translocase protein TatB
MFGLGWGEVVVIGIVALIAIGPKELPTVLRTVGQWMGKVRRMANEFQGQFNEALREAEFADLKKHADDITSSVNEFSNLDPLGDVQKDVEREFANVDLNAEVKSAEVKPAAATDGAALPDGILPASDALPLPQIEVPLPPEHAPVTEKDFAPAKPSRAKPASVKPAPARAKKAAKKPVKKTGSRA